MNCRRMNYLDKKGAKELDDDVMKACSTSMEERTIPDIEKEVRKNEGRAAKLRFSTDPASRRWKVIVGNKIMVLSLHQNMLEASRTRL